MGTRTHVSDRGVRARIDIPSFADIPVGFDRSRRFCLGTIRQRIQSVSASWLEAVVDSSASSALSLNVARGVNGGSTLSASRETSSSVEHEFSLYSLRKFFSTSLEVLHFFMAIDFALLLVSHDPHRRNYP